MIHIQGIDGCAPTRRLTEALARLAPPLLAGSDRNRAHLTIVPRHDDVRDDSGWYDAYWSHPTVELIEDWPTGTTHAAGTHALIGERIAAIPAPSVIPVEVRLAAADPVTLDGVSEAQLRMYGGEQGVREILESRRDIAIRHDRTVDAYDWDALAVTVAALVAGLTPPRLTAGQRAHVAAARLLDAIQRVPAERTSMAEHLRNAEQAGEQDVAEHLRGLLDAIDPTTITTEV